MKLSVITINYNNFKGLRKTMMSVFSQTCAEFEYIVVDGGSTDESLEVLKEFNDNPVLSGRFNWISESDNGIYHAMNKGICLAGGDFLLFLNSGDELVDRVVLEKVCTEIQDKTEICSGILYILDKGEKTIKYPIKELSLSYCYYGGLTHPNTFIRKSLFGKYGLYNENNKIVSDWEFFLHVAYFHHTIYQAVNIPIANFYMDGISAIPNNPVTLEETKRVVENEIPHAVRIDIERLNLLEHKISQINFKAVDYLMQKHSLTAKIVFFPLEILYYVLKKKNKLNF